MGDNVYRVRRGVFGKAILQKRVEVQYGSPGTLGFSNPTISTKHEWRDVSFDEASMLLIEKINNAGRLLDGIERNDMRKEEAT